MSHIHELYDFTVSAFIVHEGRVLLMYHARLKTWLQPGGHIELNEDPETALWREIEEETGLTQKQLTIIEPVGRAARFDDNSGNHKRLPLPFDLNVHPYGEGGNHRHIDLCYSMTSSTSEVKNNAVESRELRWFDAPAIEKCKDELLEDIYTRSLFVLNATR